MSPLPKLPKWKPLTFTYRPLLSPTIYRSDRIELSLIEVNLESTDGKTKWTLTQQEAADLLGEAIERDAIAQTEVKPETNTWHVHMASGDFFEVEAEHYLRSVGGDLILFCNGDGTCAAEFAWSSVIAIVKIAAE